MKVKAGKNKISEMSKPESKAEVQLDGSKIPVQLEFKKGDSSSPNDILKDDEGVDEISFERSTNPTSHRKPPSKP